MTTTTSLTTLTCRRARSTADLAVARRLHLASIERDQGYGYRPDWHWDIDHLLEVYVDNPRNVMLLAQIDGEVVGACGIRVGLPRNTPALTELLPPREQVAQVVRLVVEPAWRRRGIAQHLVAAALGHVDADGGYSVVYLHTNARTPGAVHFWEALGARRLELPADQQQVEENLEVVHMLLRSNLGTH